MKKTVLIVTSEFPPQPGGIGNHALELATALVQEGFEIIVMSDERSLEGLVERSYDACLPFAVKRIKFKRFRPLMYVIRLLTLFKLIKNCDNVIGTGKFSLWAVALCNLFYKKHSLAVIHGTEVNLKSLWSKKMVFIALKQFSKVVAVSNYTAQLVAHLKLNINIIPNGILNTSWDVSGIEKVVLQGSPTLITVGRVSPRKGQLRVIEYLPELIKIHPNAHYHCVGIDTQKGDCIKMAHDLGIHDHVHFHGAVDDEKLKQLILSGDIFVMLSMESNDGDVEGFGIALLEANALGIPAIGTLGCGIEDAIDHGVSGLLVNAIDNQGFVDAVSEILNNYEYYQKSAKIWAAKHDWKDLATSYKRLLE